MALPLESALPLGYLNELGLPPEMTQLFLSIEAVRPPEPNTAPSGALEQYQAAFNQMERFPRVYGLWLAQQYGAATVRGVTLLEDGLFRRWEQEEIGKPAGSFSSQDREAIRIVATHLIKQYGRIVVRRAFNIPNESWGIGSKFFLNITEPEVAVKGLEEIYKEGLGLEQTYLAQANGVMVENPRIGAFFQEHIDPPIVDLTQLTPDFRGKLPMGAYASVHSAPDGEGAIVIEVYQGYGNTRAIRDGTTFLIPIDAGGGVDPALVKVIPGNQQIMRVAVLPEQATLESGEAEVTIPASFRGRSGMGWEDLARIANTVRGVYLYAANLGWSNVRLEFQWGVRDGRYIPIATEALPYESQKELFMNFEGSGRVIAVRIKVDLQRLERELARHGKQIFVYYPPEGLVNNALLSQTLGVIKSYMARSQQKTRIILLHSSSGPNGHQVDNLMQARASWVLPYVLVGDRLRIEDGWLMRLKVEESLVRELVRVLGKGEVAIPIEDSWILARDLIADKAWILTDFARRNGLAIAGGAVIPFPIIEKILEINGVAGLITDLQNLTGEEEDFGKQLRDLFGQIESKIIVIPSELRKAIRKQIKQAFRGRWPADMIVRSAARFEDQATAPAAGQGLTIRHVSEVALQYRLLAVIRSLFSSSMVEYLLATFEPSQLPAVLKQMQMSPMVQEFVKTDVALVVFSRSTKGERYLQISYTGQECDRVVGGKSGVETIFLDRVKRKVYRYVAEGQEELIPIEINELPFDINRLWWISDRAEQYLGHKAADLELGLVGGQFVIFQLRPLPEVDKTQR